MPRLEPLGGRFRAPLAAFAVALICAGCALSIPYASVGPNNLHIRTTTGAKERQKRVAELEAFLVLASAGRAWSLHGLLTHYASSVANQRVQELRRTQNDWIAPNLWSGLARARPGAGICIVGNPEQSVCRCAAALHRYRLPLILLVGIPT